MPSSPSTSSLRQHLSPHHHILPARPLPHSHWLLIQLQKPPCRRTHPHPLSVRQQSSRCHSHLILPPRRLIPYMPTHLLDRMQTNRTGQHPLVLGSLQVHPGATHEQLLRPLFHTTPMSLYCIRTRSWLGRLCSRRFLGHKSLLNNLKRCMRSVRHCSTERYWEEEVWISLLH